METLLKDLCAKHGLTGILVHLLRADTNPFVGITLHWDTSTCCSANGDTFDEAFALALDRMAERRTSRAA
nr:MAG TPA: hypothetical protein [Caudoviricetes sp.]